MTRCRRWRPSCAGACAASAGGHASRAPRWPRASCASRAPRAGPRDGRRVTRGDSASGRRVLRRSLLMAREGGGCHGPTCSCAGAEPRGWAHPHAPPCDARAEAPLAASQCAARALPPAPRATRSSAAPSGGLRYNAFDDRRARVPCPAPHATHGE